MYQAQLLLSHPLRSSLHGLIIIPHHQELTTRDEYLATRFTKLSASGHDLTPLNLAEVGELSWYFGRTRDRRASHSDHVVVRYGVAPDEWCCCVVQPPSRFITPLAADPARQKTGWVASL